MLSFENWEGTTPSSAVPGIFDGRAAFLSAFAEAIRPPKRITVAEWAEQYRYLAPESGSPFPGKWSNAVAPYLVEPMEVLSLQDPARDVVVKKSAQTGFTETAVNLVGYSIDQVPAPILYVLPSLDEAAKFNKIKLQPTFDATPALRRKVADTKRADEDSSTGSFKRFRGGFMVLTGANSSKGLQMISARIKIDDEVSEFPSDAGGRGDPVEQGDTRTLAYDEIGYKRYRLSTPGIKGACRISAYYEASDQRHYYVPCPHCGAYQVLVWKHMKWRQKTEPFGAWYECQSCGQPIEAHHKRAIVAAGTWLKCYPGDDAPPALVLAAEIEELRHRPSRGRQPGFHIWQAYSPFVSWDSTVAKFIDADGNPTKLKAFVQQSLGEEWEERGEAPEWQRLLLRREDYAEGTIPVGGLVLTGAADVQKDGIYYEIVAWGAAMTTWTVEARFLPGETADENGSAWTALRAVFEAQYRDAFGNRRVLDLAAVDAGYNTNQVYTFVRRHLTWYAIKGQPGWYHPPIGTPSKQDVTFGGRKIKAGVQLWPIGTWGLKGALYANLRKDGRTAGAEADPAGYCHFGTFLDERYFQQLTAEYLADREQRGRVVKEWVAGGPNHFHDCRIYNMALAEHLRLSQMRPEDWAALAAQRNVPADSQADLLDLMRPPVVAAPSRAVLPAPAPVPPAPEPAKVRPHRDGWLNHGRGPWLRRH